VIVAFEAYDLCDFLLVNMLVPFNETLNVSFLACFQVVSNRLWAHTKQEKRHCVGTRNSQGFCLYNIERKFFWGGRLLVCKVAKRV